ncbi:MAG: Methenyltetrahydrofolate cyclohydrolase [Candidatus Dichloromethanomonas elyunquensis]|nr:MAG: Methenyltetrahydrofolate cyclohydrolase [Candidatus Dichloromethanomonas elyunquensis]
MSLTEYNLKEFISILASKEPAPGGGSASALAGAVGAALALMVANLTLGKEQYIHQEPLMQKIIWEAGNLQKEFIELIDLDTEAFNQVGAVFEMPKDSAEEKKKRQAAMQSALKYATMTPLAIMEKALMSLRLIDEALGKTNPSAESDFGVGALCLKAAMQGGWLNMKINLGCIKDQEFVIKYTREGESILVEGLSLADKIYRQVLESLN